MNSEHLRQERRILNVTNEYSNTAECHNTCLSHAVIQEQTGCQAAIVAPVMPEEHMKRRAFTQNHADLWLYTTFQQELPFWDWTLCNPLYNQEVKKTEKYKAKRQKPGPTYCPPLAERTSNSHEPLAKQIHHHHHQCIPSGTICPISHHPVYWLSCSNVSLVTTFNLKCKNSLVVTYQVV